MKAEIKFLGTGGAFDIAQGNSAAIVNWQGKKILLDCGYTVYTRLRELNLVDALDYVLITHLHDDHVGSLSTLLYHRHFITNNPLTLLYPDDAFRDVLCKYLAYPMQNAENYCTLEVLASLAGTDYVDTYGLHVPEMYTYAYLFGEGEDGIVFSGDLGDGNFLFKYLDQMPDCPTTVFHDTCFRNTRAHAHYSVVQTHLDKYKIYGYHHNPAENPADNKIPLVANNQQFLV